MVNYVYFMTRAHEKLYKSCVVPGCQSNTMEQRKINSVFVLTDLMGLRRSGLGLRTATASRVVEKTEIILHKLLLLGSFVTNIFCVRTI